MAKIIVVGGGIGGIPMAYQLRDEIANEHQITLLSDSPQFHFVPSNPWVAVNWRKREDIIVDLAAPITAKGITFSSLGVRNIKPEQNRIILNDDSELDYDYLIIATGSRLAFDEIEGLGPEQFTQSICHIDHAEKSQIKWQEFVKNPGPIVVGAAPGASCFGPAYEFAFILDADLRKRKIRDQVPMTYVTPEPYIGHMGLDGVGDSKTLLESEFRSRHIDWITNAKITSVEENTMYITECDEQGEGKKKHILPFNYAMVLPAFTGVDAVRNIEEEGVVNPRGFTVVDKYQRNPRYKNIYSVGVCVSIAPNKLTPVPTGVPKTGYMIESMVAAVVKNIAAELKDEEPYAEATWNAICFADMGDSGIAMVALPQIPPRNLSWSKKGKWVHYVKIAYEKFFLHKVRSGSTNPFYERKILSLLGIEKLKKR